MKTLAWQGWVRWLFGVALATTLVLPSQANSWGGDPLDLSLRPLEESLRVVAVPSPPEPPEPPQADQAGEAPESAAPPEPPAPERAASEGLVLDEPIFEDPRAEAVVSLPPGIPVPTYPVVMNAPVGALIDYFAARDRDRFGLWIARSGRYVGMIQRIFREHGLPEELAYTAMIESGFSARAVSRVGAKGLWQFMEGTARRYGLVVNRWVDERLDPVKATVAAARYLGDLYGMFGHWFLAQAAYNAGETRVARAVQRARTSDFWALTQTRHLPDETKMFVPQILAATVITREPGRYGFDVQMEPPLAYDEVTVKRALDLETIAQLAEVTVEVLHELNPALLARITPPVGAYVLRLPAGVGARFEAALRDAPPGRLPKWGVHRVARGQSLAEIARQYRVTPQRLVELNRLPGGRLRGVTELAVPVSGGTPPAGERGVAQAQPSPPKNRPAGSVRGVVVQRGETLGTIAARHGLKPQNLARLNGMEVGDLLQAGARLKLSTP